MWRILKFLFTGTWHEHKWKIFEQGFVVDIGDSGEKITCGRWYHLQCETCGDIKNRVLLT